MAAATGVSVEQYLTSVYEPDCDYVDGEVLERNLGEFDHSTVQGIIISTLMRKSDDLEFRTKPELRMRLSASRYRVPDVLVLRRDQAYEPVLTSPPCLCIEILSPEDRMLRITAKVKEYLAFGVEFVWVIDPQNETAWQYSSGGSTEVRNELTTGESDLSLSVTDLFSRLAKHRSRQT